MIPESRRAAQKKASYHRHRDKTIARTAARTKQKLRERAKAHNHGELPARCEICGSVGDKLLCWDHCHDCGDFRGFLCAKCNSALGLMKDDPEIAENAAAYLRRHLSDI